MAENPLLPNAELQALLALTRHCITLDKTARRQAASRKPRARAVAPLPFREAFLAGSAVQLRPGDLLVGEPGDATTAKLGPAAEDSNETPPTILPNLRPDTPRLLLAAAFAAALRAAGTEAIVLAFARQSAAEPGWNEALAWAQERQLPLILACADPRGPNAFRDDPRASKAALSWQTVSRAAKRLQLPVLTLDGEDAVAMYRSTQESILRARAGGGPAILWAMLPDLKSAVPRPPSAQPLRRLQQYLRARKIPF